MRGLKIVRVSSFGRVLAGAVVAAGVLVSASLPASAQSRCKVTDPTATPLNVRTSPLGRIVGTLPNGKLVSVAEYDTDSKGRAWAYVCDYHNGRPIGWVYREFITCY